MDPPPGFGEDQETHKEWNMDLARLLVEYSGKGSNGGCVMSWMDEWWKTGVNGLWGCSPIIGTAGFNESGCVWKGHVDCPSQNILRHQLCGYWTGSTFDHYVNEAWFGINAVEKASKPGNVDELIPRKLFFALQSFWTNISDTFTGGSIL